MKNSLFKFKKIKKALLEIEEVNDDKKFIKIWIEIVVKIIKTW